MLHSLSIQRVQHLRPGVRADRSRGNISWCINDSTQITVLILVCADTVFFTVHKMYTARKVHYTFRAQDQSAYIWHNAPYNMNDDKVTKVWPTMHVLHAMISWSVLECFLIKVVQNSWCNNSCLPGSIPRVRADRNILGPRGQGMTFLLIVS